MIFTNVSVMVVESCCDAASGLSNVGNNVKQIAGFVLLNSNPYKKSHFKIEIACESLENMEQKNERVNVNLMNLFKALKEPKFVPSNKALDLAAHLLKRLFQIEEKNESAEILQELIIVENHKVLTMESRIKF
jgi:hypothetical protein